MILLQQNDKLKRILCNICGELIVLVAPKTLSTLHLASFHKSIITKEKKELLKLSKKMLKIITRFSGDALQVYKQNETHDDINLFYDVYNNKDNLTLKELKALRDYYYLIESNHQFDRQSSDVQSYVQYSDNLDESIDKKRLRKFFSL